MSITARLGRWLRSLRHAGEPAEVARQRAHWQAIVLEHGLSFEPGPHPGFVDDDRIHGRVDGRAVSVRIFPDYDLQKLVVQLTISCDVATPSRLPRDELVAWYEARRHAADLPPIDPELAPWVLGRRLGVGAFLEPERELVYVQLYEIEPDTLRMLLARLPRWADQLERAARS